MAKYLDNNGLLYFWQKIKTTFAKVADLSTVATSGSYNDLNNKPTLFSGSYNDLTDKPVIPEGADLTGYATETWVGNQGYQTSSDVQSAINTALSGITGVDFKIVSELPVTGDAGTIYLVQKSSSATGNVYTEWIYVNNAWEKLGDTTADLSGYVQTSDLVAITNAEIDTTMAS